MREYCTYYILFPRGLERQAVHRGVAIVASFLFLTGTISIARPNAPRIAQSALTAVGVSSRAQDERGAVLEPGKPIERKLAGVDRILISLGSLRVSSAM